MKSEIDSVLAWITETAAKYGLIALVLLAVWFGIKRVWFWVLMPIMFLIFLQQLAIIFGWGFVAKISTVSIIISWVFVFSCLKKLCSFFVEPKR
jgi:hypothetical protein